MIGNQRVAPGSGRLSCGRPARRMMGSLGKRCDLNSCEGKMPSRQPAGRRRYENLILRKLFHGLEQVGGLGQDGILQVGVVRHVDVHRGDPAYWRIQVFE